MADSNRRQVPRVVEALATVPWAITDEALSTIEAIALRENEVTPEALEAYRSKAVPGSEILAMRGSVGIISIAGPMFRYGNFFTAISGAATYDDIAAAVTRAKDDPMVRSVIFNLDTPGGEVNGLAELAGMVRALAAVKATEAYVGGQACSAGYWLASATSYITVDRTAVLGSIGVRLGIRDSSERDAKSGVRTIEFISSNAPNKRADYSSDEGKARIQRMADQMEAVFLDEVATNRGVSVDEVIAKFGAGGVEVGADAVEAGMADALGSFESVVSRLAAGNGHTATERRTFAMATGNDKTKPEANTEDGITQAQLDKAAADARAEGQTAGAEAAQKRIADILASDEGKANRTLAEHFAFKTTMSTEDAVAALAAAGPAASAPATPDKPKTTEGRAQDAAGGLALDTATGGSHQPEKPTAPKLNPQSIYNKRREVANAAR